MSDQWDDVPDKAVLFYAPGDKRKVLLVLAGFVWYGMLLGALLVYFILFVLELT